MNRNALESFRHDPYYGGRRVCVPALLRDPIEATPRIRVILIFFLRLAYAWCAPGVRPVCARLGADGYLHFSLVS